MVYTISFPDLESIAVSPIFRGKLNVGLSAVSQNSEGLIGEPNASFGGIEQSCDWYSVHDHAPVVIYKRVSFFGSSNEGVNSSSSMGLCLNRSFVDSGVSVDGRSIRRCRRSLYKAIFVDDVGLVNGNYSRFDGGVHVGVGVFTRIGMSERTLCSRSRYRFKQG